MDASTPAQLFGRQLAELRSALGLSQRAFTRQIEERVGVTMDPATLARIEKAKGKRVTLDEVFALAAGLGVSPLHLLAPRAGKGRIAIGQTAHDHRAVRAWLRATEALEGEPDPAWGLGALPDEPSRALRAELERAVDSAATRVRFLVTALADARATLTDAEQAYGRVQHEHQRGAGDDREELAAAEAELETADRRHRTFEQELEAASAERRNAEAQLAALQRSMDEMGY